jgi:hypothetical protein
MVQEGASLSAKESTFKNNGKAGILSRGGKSRVDLSHCTVQDNGRFLTRAQLFFIFCGTGAHG